MRDGITVIMRQADSGESKGRTDGISLRQTCFSLLLSILILQAATTATFAAEPEQPPTNGAAEILFKDDFERPGSAIDAAKWRVSKTADTDIIEVRHNAWPNTGGFAVITDSGDRGGAYHGHASAIASQMSFSRGRNLRCSFRVAMPRIQGRGSRAPGTRPTSWFTKNTPC